MPISSTQLVAFAHEVRKIVPASPVGRAHERFRLNALNVQQRSWPDVRTPDLFKRGGYTDPDRARTAVGTHAVAVAEPPAVDGRVYIVEAEGKRHVAERAGSMWMPTGFDYDPWIFSPTMIEVRVLARINLETLEIEK